MTAQRNTPENRGDPATAHHLAHHFPVVIARRGKAPTRQSSCRVGQPPPIGTFLLQGCNFTLPFYYSPIKVMKNIRLLLFLFLLPWSLSAAPIPYSGKVAINGANFQGDAQFTFALRDADGTIHWRNGVDAESGVTLNVDRGLYVCLLGGSTMNDFPKNLFLQNSPLFLVVHFFRLDTGQWLHLQPDQRITSAPHALAAEVANLANLAKAVLPGAITKNMLAADVLADLNATVVLPEQNATIQTGSITRDMLAPNVLSDLNATVAPSSITAGQLAPALLADLNRSVVITRNMLPASVLEDLNRTINAKHAACLRTVRPE